VTFGLVVFLARGPAAANLPVSSHPPAAQVVQVHLLLTTTSAGPLGAACTVADLEARNVPIPGEQLTVTDEGGVILGYAVVPSTGTVVAAPGSTPGSTSSSGPIPGGSASATGSCSFDMPIGVADGARSYTFTVGDISGPTVSHDALAAAGWSESFGR